MWLRGANVPQLSRGGFEKARTFGPNNHCRTTREDFDRTSPFQATFTTRRLCPAEVIQKTPLMESAGPAVAGAEDLDLDRRSAAAAVPSLGWFAVAVDEGAATPCQMGYSNDFFERESGDFRARVVDGVGVELFHFTQAGPVGLFSAATEDECAGDDCAGEGEDSMEGHAGLRPLSQCEQADRAEGDGGQDQCAGD